MISSRSDFVSLTLHPENGAYLFRACGLGCKSERAVFAHLFGGAKKGGQSGSAERAAYADSLHPNC
jgi:hypothetical protein